MMGARRALPHTCLALRLGLHHNVDTASANLASTSQIVLRPALCLRCCLRLLPTWMSSVCKRQLSDPHPATMTDHPTCMDVRYYYDRTLRHTPPSQSSTPSIPEE